MYSSIYKDDYSLFDYQTQSKKEIFSAWCEHDAVLFQMPTGTGKTRLFTSIIRDIIKWGTESNERVKIIVVAHRKELIDQIDASLEKYEIQHGIIAGGYQRDLHQKVLVASIQTLSQNNKEEQFRELKANFLIIDEAHHSIAPTYEKLWDYFPNAKILGVTATPWDMRRIGFRHLYGNLILSLQPREFIKIGRLAPYDYYSIQNFDSAYKLAHDIHEFSKDGDYKLHALERNFDTPQIRAKLLESYLKYAKGKKGIIYSICREHSKHICQEYAMQGIRITDIDGETPKTERERKIEEFKNGEIDIIVNVDIFSEGFDCPDIEFIQLARPTRSLVKYIQQVGRGLRVSKNKECCIILDNVGAIHDFGLPDKDRDWSCYFTTQKVEHVEKADIDLEEEEKIKKKRNYNLGEGHESMVKIASRADFAKRESIKRERLRDKRINKLIDKNLTSFCNTIGDDDTALDIWIYIESNHEVQSLRLGNSYVMTLYNGYTYIYTMTDEGRLLSINDFFQGYTDQYGTIEAGYPYAVLLHKDRLYIKELQENFKKAKVLAQFKNTHDVYQSFFDAFEKPIKIEEEHYGGSMRYVVIATPNPTRFVSCVNTLRIVDKFSYSNYDDYGFFRILCRLPYKPYRYAIVEHLLFRDIGFIDLVSLRFYKIFHLIYKRIRIDELNDGSIIIRSCMTAKIYGALLCREDNNRIIYDAYKELSLKGEEYTGSYKYSVIFGKTRRVAYNEEPSMANNLNVDDIRDSKLISNELTRDLSYKTIKICNVRYKIVANECNVYLLRELIAKSKACPAFSCHGYNARRDNKCEICFGVEIMNMYNSFCYDINYQTYAELTRITRQSPYVFSCHFIDVDIKAKDFKYDGLYTCSWVLDLELKLDFNNRIHSSEM